MVVFTVCCENRYRSKENGGVSTNPFAFGKFLFPLSTTVKDVKISCNKYFIKLHNTSTLIFGCQ